MLESEGLRLPPVYFGAVDSTLLWLCLLSELWHTGKADDAVRALLPNARRAAAWLLAVSITRRNRYGGKLRIPDVQDPTGHGLSNQGWKDSVDAMQFRDGRLADGPIALAEVQGVRLPGGPGHGGALRRQYGDAGDARDAGDATAGKLRDFAAALQQRFRERFWVEDAVGRFPAMALDGGGVPLDIPGSNMGHLLGTGILSPAEAHLVAARLLSPELFSGYGIHTMSRRAAGFWPFSYHCGSVWSHDTAIAIRGLLADGFMAEARTLADGLLTASEAFGHRLPELFAGALASQSGHAVPYPASCHPQAWSSASAVVVAQALGALA